MEHAIETVERIQRDFSEQNQPFHKIEFPEERLLEELPHNSMEDRARIISMFCTFDYNRDANQLTDKIIELHKKEPSVFDAWQVNSEKTLRHHFEKVGFRYPNRDAHAWAENCHILRVEYSGKWTELLLSVSSDAETLVEQLESDDFLCLKGVKIAPMYARFIDEYVAPLSNVWELDIPVDTHIARLSRDLFDDEDMSHDMIREEWRGLATEADVQRNIIDGALWQIGNNWNQWGEVYWLSVTQS